MSVHIGLELFGFLSEYMCSGINLYYLLRCDRSSSGLNNSPQLHLTVGLQGNQLSSKYSYRLSETLPEMLVLLTNQAVDAWKRVQERKPTEIETLHH